jgi:trehalose-phosphatase
MNKLLKQLEKDLKKSKKKLFLFDYDGTLTPIVRDPKKALLSKSMKVLLKELSEKPEVAVGMVTGRGLKDIKKFVHLKNLFYLTNHGYLLEMSGRLTSLASHIFGQKAFLVKVKKIRGRLKKYKNVTIEQKETSLSFHYRNVAPSLQAECKQSVIELVADNFSKKDIRIKEGKKVLELLPAKVIDKGIAIKKYIAKFRQKNKGSYFAFFIGDDLTDEDGFRYMNSISKYTVKVGNGKTLAKNRVKNVTEVKKLLKEIVKIL